MGIWIANSIPDAWKDSRLIETVYTSSACGGFTHLRIEGTDGIICRMIVYNNDLLQE